MSSGRSCGESFGRRCCEQPIVPGGEGNRFAAITLDGKRGCQVQGIQPPQAMLFGQVSSVAEKRFGHTDNANGGPALFKLI